MTIVEKKGPYYALLNDGTFWQPVKRENKQSVDTILNLVERSLQDGNYVEDHLKYLPYLRYRVDRYLTHSESVWIACSSIFRFPGIYDQLVKEKLIRSFGPIKEDKCQAPSLSSARDWHTFKQDLPVNLIIKSKESFLNRSVFQFYLFYPISLDQDKDERLQVKGWGKSVGSILENEKREYECIIRDHYGRTHRIAFNEYFKDIFYKTVLSGVHEKMKYFYSVHNVCKIAKSVHYQFMDRPHLKGDSDVPFEVDMKAKEGLLSEMTRITFPRVFKEFDSFESEFTTKNELHKAVWDTYGPKYKEELIATGLWKKTD